MLIADITKNVIIDGESLGMPPYHLGAVLGLVGWIIALTAWFRGRGGVAATLLQFVFSLEIGVAGLAAYVIVGWDWAGEVGSGATYDPVLMHSEMRHAGSIAMIALAVHGVTMLTSLLFITLYRKDRMIIHECA